jgi:hypothetical protein
MVHEEALSGKLGEEINNLRLKQKQHNELRNEINSTYDEMKNKQDKEKKRLF